ncbi:hypothetical protein [Mycolicibacterium sp. 120270]|uniref:hypothetical protein n=1 Tax=Mycolicibacterium sp. 120270 TaxID=3090600 RepID=UPI00299D207A|nr:hypothetical protein [Mycolicibacterium sp. 120270]MDX1885120.1 hypothetical protein [Mycolicibacterium sp. 120270]
MSDPDLPSDGLSAPKTGIIRRAPTGPLPALDEPRTTHIDTHSHPESQTTYIPRARPQAIGGRAAVRPKTAAATAVFAILSGWATAVIATDLITGWWASDRLFCVAVGFLTVVSGAALISGLIALLLRRRMARVLIVVGSVIALLIFASLFVAGAKLAPVVYAIPALPVITIVLTLLPATARWARP